MFTTSTATGRITRVSEQMYVQCTTINCNIIIIVFYLSDLATLRPSVHCGSVWLLLINPINTNSYLHKCVTCLPAGHPAPWWGMRGAPAKCAGYCVSTQGASLLSVSPERVICWRGVEWCTLRTVRGRRSPPVKRCARYSPRTGAL